MSRIETLDKACGTNVDTPHREKYAKYIDFIGRDTVEHYIPFSEQEIADALSKDDDSLNTLSLKTWDAAAGYVENSRTGAISRIGGLADIVGAKIEYFSPSECMIMLKEAARARYERNQAQT